MTSLGKYAASTLALCVVAGIGLFARKAAPETPLTIEPMPVGRLSSNPRARDSEPHTESVQTEQVPTTPQKFAVHVAGEVVRPGVYWLPSGGRVFEAVRLAGGALRTADTEQLNLALPVVDGMKIIVPSGEEREIGPRTLGKRKTTRRTGRRRSTPSPMPPLSGELSPQIPSGDQISFEEEGPEQGTWRPLPLLPSDQDSSLLTSPPETSKTSVRSSVSVNRASASQFETLPGVGPMTAEKIVAERKRRRGFRKIEDLLEVRGIGPVKFAKMRPFLQL